MEDILLWQSELQNQHVRLEKIREPRDVCVHARTNFMATVVSSVLVFLRVEQL